MRRRVGAPDRRHQDRGATFGEPGRRELTSTILGSYHEMPGLKLSLEQAARLFGLRIHTCEIVLDDLVRSGSLTRAPGGQFIRMPIEVSARHDQAD